jgi:hypothetical protein
MSKIVITYSADAGRGEYRINSSCTLARSRCPWEILMRAAVMAKHNDGLVCMTAEAAIAIAQLAEDSID